MARWQPDAPQRLALAALELFAERGYENTTVIDIAQRAGLTKSTFFRHFQDKREVLFGNGTMNGLLAEAIAAAVKPWKINYECLGNSEPHVHWHLLPRYETDEMRRGPIWLRPESERKVALDENNRRSLIGSIRHQLAVRFPDARIPSA